MKAFNVRISLIRLYGVLSQKWGHSSSTVVFYFISDGQICEFISGSDSGVDSCLLLLCHSHQGSHQPDNAGRHAGVKTWRSSQLDDPSKFAFDCPQLLPFFHICCFFSTCCGSAQQYNKRAPYV